MPQYHRYPTPHLLGRVDYSGVHRFDPDGDTIHLRNPVLLVDGRAIKPKNGSFTVWMPGNHKPRSIVTKGKTGSYVPIRFEGIDAPEEHYRATPFDLKQADGTKKKYTLNPLVPHNEKSQPQWRPATSYVVTTLQRAGWALVTLDREVTDRYKRVLGYVYASDSRGRRGTFVSLQLVKRGLAFPFLFESAGDLIPVFLKAANNAKRQGHGVWQHYVDAPLTYQETFDRPQRYTSPEPAGQSQSQLNLPMVFRRVVDSAQLARLSLADALRKYDAIDYPSGNLVPGDRFQEIPIERRIWAPHQYDK